MLIKLNGLTKKIKGNVVLEDINLEFESGKIYGLVGKNGSGKTMLMRVLCGFVLPSKGSIQIDNKLLHRDISFLPNLGTIIEKPELLNYLTGFENLKLLAEIKNIISDKEIKEFMIKFGLDPDSKLIMKKYSLGMKQKIGIIQAIMENQNILILDEPFNALDEETVSILRELLLQYKKDGKLLIITSHNKEDIDLLCDNIVYIENGKIINNK